VSRAAFNILSTVDRQKASEIISKAPIGAHFSLRESTRTLPQNDLMWMRLRDVAEQVDWYGETLTDTDWKDMFTASLRRARIVRNIDGDGFVQLGLHTSALTIPEMTLLLDLLDAFGAQRGVKFRDQQDSPGAETQADTPAAGNESPDPAPVAGVLDQASDLSDDWRYVYLTALSGVRDRFEDLPIRHAQALQMIGGKPNEREKAWMVLAYRAVEYRNKGKMQAGDFDARLAELFSMPLPPANGAAC
jgi:NinB protein